jgi:hypothetical protein
MNSIHEQYDASILATKVQLLGPKPWYIFKSTHGIPGLARRPCYKVPFPSNEGSGSYELTRSGALNSASSSSFAFMPKIEKTDFRVCNLDQPLTLHSTKINIHSPSHPH